MRSCQGPLFWKFGRRFNPPPKETMQLLPPHPPTSYQVFTRFVVLQEILYQPFFALIRLLQKIMHFQSKTNFLILLIAGRFWFCCFVYVFLRVLFHSSAIMKLQIALYLHIFIASYLTSHQIMWHKKRINGHGLKITSCCYFFGFREN